MKLLTRLTPLFAFVPFVAFAQGELDEVGTFLSNIVDFMNNVLVPLVFAIAFLVFIWGVFKYFILAKDNEDDRKEGRTYMLYAIAGFVIMVSIWGIVNLLAEGFGLTEENIQNVPNVQLDRS